MNGACDASAHSLSFFVCSYERVHLHKRHMRRCGLDLRCWWSYATVIWCILEWSLPDCQHRVVSQRLPTELFSSAPFLHVAIFLVFLRERGIKPQPIYGWSNRMIQKLAHIHTHTNTHRRSHLQLHRDRCFIKNWTGAADCPRNKTWGQNMVIDRWKILRPPSAYVQTRRHNYPYRATLWLKSPSGCYDSIACGAAFHRMHITTDSFTQSSI